jgi:hypothetical protein
MNAGHSNGNMTSLKKINKKRIISFLFSIDLSWKKIIKLKKVAERIQIFEEFKKLKSPGTFS